jgi:hypothetical protein
MKYLSGRKTIVATAVAVAIALTGGFAWAANPFVDVAGNTHEANIDAIYNAGITTGCDTTHYCPSDFVSRGQMGTFLARVAGVGKGNFTKTNGRSDRGAYCALARANVGALPIGPCGTWQQTLLASGVTGRIGIAVGVDGLPAVAYQSSSGVRFVHCDDATCTSSTDKTIDSGGTLSSIHPLAIGIDGFPVIAYKNSFGGITIAHCTDVACASGGVASFDGGIGADSASITIGADGIPIVSYQRFPSDGDLAFARCANVACSSVITLVLLDGTGNTGFGNTIAIGADGLPVVTYRRAGTPGTAMLVHCADAACAAVDTPVAVGAIAAQTNVLNPTIAIGANGLPLVAYASETNALPAVSDVVVAACNNAGCTTSVKHTISSTRGNGVEAVAALGLDGRAVIASIVHNGVDPMTAEVMRCTDAACTTGVAISSTPLADGTYTSMAMGVDGTPLFAVRDSGVLYLIRPPA